MSLRSLFSAVGLGGDDLQVGVHAAHVTVVEDPLRFLGARPWPAAVAGFLLQDAQGDEVVLHLLVGGEDGLAVVGDRAGRSWRKPAD